MAGLVPAIPIFWGAALHRIEITGTRPVMTWCMCDPVPTPSPSDRALGPPYPTATGFLTTTGVRMVTSSSAAVG